MICKRLKFTIKVNLTKVTYNHNTKNLNVLYEVSLIKDLARFTGQNLNIVLKTFFFSELLRGIVSEKGLSIYYAKL